VLLQRSFYILLLLLITFQLPVQATGSRDLIIQRVMDCVDHRMLQKSGITWNDVCDISYSADDDRTRDIDQSMNQAEENIQNEVPKVLVSQPIAPPIVPLAAVQDVPSVSLAQRKIIMEEVPQNDQTIHKKSDLSLLIAPEVSHITYRESGVKESGVMSGVNVNFSFRPPDGNRMKTPITDVYAFEGMFTYGRVDYNGGLIHGNGTITPESFNGINDYMIELRGITGKDYDFNNQSTRLTPYLGGGYRSLFDASSVNKPGGYNRRIQYLYFPTGINLTTKLIGSWSLGANVEYDFFIRGFVTSYLGEIGLGDVTNTQKGGFGLRGSIKLIRVGNTFNLFLEPFVRFWDIHRSRVDASGPFYINGSPYYFPDSFYEPHNTSIEMGGKFGIEF